MGIEKSLRLVFDYCRDGVLVCRADPTDLLTGRITYVNDALCRRTGFTRQELEGEAAGRVIWSGPEESNRWSAVLTDPSLQQPVRLSLRCKDGSVVEEEAEAWLIRDSEENANYAVFRLNAAGPQPALSTTIADDQTRACIFTTDLQGIVTSWNQGAAKATGFSADEVLGRDIRTLCRSAGSGCLPDDIIEILLKTGSFDFSLPLRRKDGEIAHQAFALSLLRDASGAPAGFLSVSVAIADFARQEKALRESSQLLGAIQHLQLSSMSGGDVRTVLQESLSTLMQMTDSVHGFCGEVLKDRQGEIYIRADTIQTRSKEPDVLQFFEPHLQSGFEFRRENSLIGHVLKHSKPVLSNSPASDPRASGFPAGHPLITSFAGIPLLTVKGMVGMVGLANRPGGYDTELLRRLQPLLDCCANIIDFSRARDNASSLAAMFHLGFENSREALVIVNVDGEIVDWNPKAEQLFGYMRSEALGKEFVATCCSAGTLSYRDIAATIHEQGHWESVISFRRGAEEEETTVEMTGFPVAGDGAPLFMFVIRDVTWRLRTEQALRESSDRFDAFAQNARCAFWISSPDAKQILYTSPALKAIAGLDPPLDQNVWNEMIHPDDRARFHATIADYLNSGLPVQHKYRIVLPDGRIRWIQSSAFPVRDARSEIYRLAGLLEDVTEHEEAVAKLHVALAEKEELLKEIHHRVKNNLQIISSLLRLQSTSSRDPESIAFLQESRNRVETIALLHEYLHQSDNLSRVNFSTYVRRLVTKLMSVNPSAERVEVQFDIEPMMLDSQRIVLCGLILNELISNSLRHGFSDGRKGKIRIQAKTENGKMISVNVGDNGSGLPKGFELERVSTLGLRLVRRLTHQLGGTVSIANQRGVNVYIKFPWPRGQREEA